MVAKKVDFEESMTPAERAHRILEISSTIAPLAKEMAEHEAWLKANVPAGEYPGDGFKVKRWEQIGSALEDKIKADFPLTDYPDYWREMSIVTAMKNYLPRADYPDCYEDGIDTAALKEKLDTEERKTYFKQIAYLKVTKA